MTPNDYRQLYRAYLILDRLTEDQPSSKDKILNARLNESFDGLSGLVFYIERHPHLFRPSFSIRLRRAWQKFYYKVFMGRLEGDI